MSTHVSHSTAPISPSISMSQGALDMPSPCDKCIPSEACHMLHIPGYPGPAKRLSKVSNFKQLGQGLNRETQYWCHYVQRKDAVIPTHFLR